ncbi:MAG: hypothetical protein ACUZ8I_13335 [Candidatus Scalindua sp.]
MDETTLYYIYSTIAQTLAGAFGILGAFTLFRLQSITGAIKGICTVIDVEFSFPESYEFNRLYTQEKWHDYYNKARSKERLEEIRKSTSKEHQEMYDAYTGALGDRLLYRETIIESVKKILYQTVITIALSIILLPLSPFLSGWLSIILLSITIICTIVCLSLYVGLVVKALDLKS